MKFPEPEFFLVHDNHTNNKEDFSDVTVITSHRLQGTPYYRVKPSVHHNVQPVLLTTYSYSYVLSNVHRQKVTDHLSSWDLY